MTYQIKVNNGSWETVNKNDIRTAGNTARYMKLGLSKNTAYSFYLRAKNSDGKTSEDVKVVGMTNLPEIAAFGASGQQAGNYYNFYQRLTNDSVRNSMNTFRSYFKITNTYSPIENPSATTVLNTIKENAEICYITGHGSTSSIKVSGDSKNAMDSVFDTVNITKMPPNSLSHIKLMVLDSCGTANSSNRCCTNLFQKLTELSPVHLVAFADNIKVSEAEYWCKVFLRFFSANIENYDYKFYGNECVRYTLDECKIPANSTMRSYKVSYKGEIIK